MKGRSGARPRCIIIAGPDGAGKTSFAREFLPKEAGIVHFMNVDFISSGLSPLCPELAAFRARRLFLEELDRFTRLRLDFAFESTLSGPTHLRCLKSWKAAGYQIEIMYLHLSSAQIALRRIAARVRQGGHHVTRQDVLWGFDRSWNYFHTYYRPLADHWEIYDTSTPAPQLVAIGP